MRKAYLLVLLLSFLFIHHSFANSGFCENYAILKINGGTNTYYDLQATTGNPDFNGANLGNFNIGSNTLILNGGENKFFKCGTDAITQSYLYYRIYKTTATPGVFISSQIFYNSNVVTACNCGGTDELWNATAANINVLNGLTPGTYYLEVYANADYTYVSGSGTHYANNGAANYKATFTVTPVYVTSTTGTSPATYNTLKDAFDALNAGTHKGTIAISIYGNTTETATAQLRNSGYLGLSSYISVCIQPAGGSARTVSGNIAGELVDFYGATNVSVDGLNSGGNSLIFSNINTGNANTIRLTYNASNNTITNCTILGATTGSPNATILFYSTAIAGATTGVNNNTVSNCYIGSAASNTPRYGILSQGTSSLVNTGNNISNNNVYDYFYPTSDNGGIRLSAGNTGWTITGNRLYQTATRTFLTSASTKIMYGISIIQNSSPGNGFTINNNVIGFGNNAGTGITSITGSANRIRGIYLLTGVSSTTTVNNNIIAGISQTTTAEPSLANDAGFIGILVDAGTVNTTSNTIGSLSSNTISVILPQPRRPMEVR